MSLTPQRREYIRKWQSRNRDRYNLYQRQYYWKRKKAGNPVLRKKHTDPENLIPTPPHIKMGREYELIATGLLKGSFHTAKETPSSKWDIEWNGQKIEVKSRHLSHRKGKRAPVYCFTFINHGHPDLYLLFCINQNEVIDKILLIPSSEIKGRSLGVGLKRSKWDKFKLNFPQE